MTTEFKLLVPTRCNCFVWAVRMFLAFGGHVVVSRSSFGLWPHFQWTPDRKVFYEYAPVGPQVRRKWWQVLAWFEGRPRLDTTS